MPKNVELLFSGSPLAIVPVKPDGMKTGSLNRL
jgi:hypothetical protein